MPFQGGLKTALYKDGPPEGGPYEPYRLKAAPRTLRTLRVERARKHVDARAILAHRHRHHVEAAGAIL